MLSFTKTVLVRRKFMAKEKSDLLYGTLDMLILRALQHDPRHGLAIADRALYASKLVTKCPSKYEAKGLGKDRT